MNYFTKKRLFSLMGILFFCTLCLSAFNSSQIFLNTSSLNISDQSTCPRTAATSNYNLDLNITWGYSGEERALGITLDDSGNIYIAGTIDSFGMGDNDAFIAEFDSSGNPKAINNWGGNNIEWAHDIAVDDAGYIYITGYTYSFGGNGKNAFIAKYDCFGLLQWSKFWDSGVDEIGEGIDLDNLGNIYITGWIEPQGGGGGDPHNAFVAKFNSSGNSIANFTWDSGSWDYGYDIAINGTDIYITGYTSGMGAGGEDAFIAKFNSTLHSKKNITWGHSGNDQGKDIALDSSGNIYITGTNYSSFDAFIAKFNSTLDSKMNITWHTANGGFSEGIALDASGNIYITGQYSNPPNSDDAFIAKYDSEGNSKTNITWGGSAEDNGFDIALDDSGSIYITGVTSSHGNGLQAFIVKYEPIATLVSPDDDDDDDDDDEDTAATVRLIAIIILASIGAGIAVIFILIKTGVIDSTKNKR